MAHPPFHSRASQILTLTSVFSRSSEFGRRKRDTVDENFEGARGAESSPGTRVDVPEHGSAWQDVERLVRTQVAVQADNVSAGEHRAAAGLEGYSVDVPLSEDIFQ